MSHVAIRIENLSKRYRIGEREPYKALRDTLTNAMYAPFRAVSSRLKGRRSAVGAQVPNNHIWALKDVSFEVKRGEVIGIIGRNGAGKTTLLKILSRITEPTSGYAEIHGRVGSLLEVGTGFHPELTGRENIYVNGAILGMKKAEINRKFDEIVAFAEIEKFLDTPVKRYSSGMYVRLAFAVAAHLEPEILLVDEVLAVGDATFQKKCLGKMGEVAKEGRTVLFVSHNMAAIKSLCSRCLLLNEGQIESSGTPESVIGVYLFLDIERGSIQYIRNSEGPFRFTRFWIEDEDGNILKSGSTGSYTRFVIEYQSVSNIDGFSVAMGIFDIYGSRVSHVSMMDQNMEISSSTSGRIKCIFKKLPFTSGRYFVTVSAYHHGSLVFLERHAVSFLVDDGDYFGCGAIKPGLRLGPVMLEHEWICEG
ncbi:MAG: ABC transporter ATP-binding protein [Deltaproteobacteria bacterium]|nr:MAG: ABC transporter ATP-binding protein [Deltaproteobacteria bacterium]